MSTNAADHESRADRENLVQRNPHGTHGDFKEVEGKRPQWDEGKTWSFTKTRNPDWKPGDGANDGGESLNKEHIDIDPNDEGRSAIHNYKLLISAIIPRPIGFISTRSPDGTSTNLAPYSYFQVVSSDPPVFVVGYAGALDNAKDSLRNLIATGECVINIISEHYIEAANATSVNAPYGVSEWALTGLHPAPCKSVRASRVKEAVFSIEGKLMETKEFESRRQAGKKTGVMAIIEGVRFWAREDALNEERTQLNPAVLRPMSRLGGITYGRVVEGIELTRPVWENLKDAVESNGLVKPKAEGQ